ncbi:hypothetical protein [Sphingomonas ginsenosidimutans]|jgi:hypothetical protein|uniref:Uncharacterized protein n=1 Tax=Sphingomonas ginsenosidimutans TaxID=862134 RepID=A0A2A4HUY3_9SPHN|nr:hypothetical protein [Sphingomonas ginsenosidimutans]MEE2916338.1 hypothetical protein [Pseudomonadota bacterium]PCG08336.1 hypothetical protein COA17_13250 [Sphingomonas ginsenosidimutans]
MIAALLLLLQAASADVPARFSVLAPVANQPCVRGRAPDEIVVCADPLPDQKLPLPHEVPSSLPQPVNRNADGMGALAAEGTPCAARVGGCQVGIDLLGMGTAAVRGIQKLVAPGSCCERDGEGTSTGMLVGDVIGGVARAFRPHAKAPKGERVPIDLAEPSMAGRVSP